MNKRERKSRLKDIIKTIDSSLVSINKDARHIIEEAQEKIDDLSWYLENNCIMPDGFDAEEMVNNILNDYFENDEEVEDIKNQIESLRDEVGEYIEEMNEGDRKEEWEEFYSNLEFIEDIINIEEQEIGDIDSYIDNMEQLKSNLEDLI